MLLIVLGIVNFLRGAFIGGMWWVFIGFFLKNASQLSYQRLMIRRMLEGEPVERFMKSDPVTVTSSISVRDFVEDYIYKYHYKLFPVVTNEKLEGCVSSREVKEIPRDEWGKQTVQDIIQPCSEDNSVPPQTDATDVLSVMNKSGNSRIMVVDHDRLVGIISLKDLLRFLSLKLDLEGSELKKVVGE
jgi:CBS domain-containing protein